MLVAGCHTFTLAQAREYWADKPERVQALAVVDFAEALVQLDPEITAARLDLEIE